MNHDTFEVRLAVLEAQVARIVSDIESEKDTRSRVNSEIMSSLRAIDSAQRKTEKIIWFGVGMGITAVVFWLLCS